MSCMIFFVKKKKTGEEKIPSWKPQETKNLGLEVLDNNEEWNCLFAVIIIIMLFWQAAPKNGYLHV